MSFIMDASLDTGLRLCRKAIDGKNKDRAYMRWLISGAHTQVGFDEYINKKRAKKILSKDELVAKKKKIDENCKRIEEKLSKRGE